jgi:hypothetical protein
MRFFWSALILTSLLSGCSYNYTLSERELESYLGDKFSYTQEFSLPGMAKVKADFGKLKVELGRGDGERIAVSGRAAISVQSMLKNIDASLTGRFSAIPWLDPQKGAIYLKGLEVDSVTIEPGAYTPLINPFSKQIVSALQLFLEKQPVYVLDKNNARQAMALKLGKSIKVKPGQIDFILGPP